MRTHPLIDRRAPAATLSAQGRAIRALARLMPTGTPVLIR